ncbi:MAG: FtsX-like permease family protein [Acidobacteria bacterium]|nr:FtsX-like permease family protein [Acidobacteriota bacterium]
MANWDPAGQFALLPLTDVLLFPPLDVFIRAAAWLLMVVVGLVLLLACTNLASFLLARALDCRKEVAVRLALGASRGSLVRRLLTETTLLSLLAGGAGVGLAVWLLDLLVTADLPLPAPVTIDLGLDGNVLGFTLGVSVAAGALLGLVPALQSTRPDVAGALRCENAGGGQPGQLRWRNALVVTQLTISLVLLVGAGLFLRSFQRVQSVDPGFGREPTALLTFLTPATRFTPDEARVVRRRAAGPRRRGPPRGLAAGPPRQPGQSGRGAPDRLSASGQSRRADPAASRENTDKYAYGTQRVAGLPQGEPRVPFFHMAILAGRSGRRNCRTVAPAPTVDEPGMGTVRYVNRATGVPRQRVRQPRRCAM